MFRRSSVFSNKSDDEERRYSVVNNFTMKLLATICSRDGSFENGVYSPIGLQSSFTFFSSCSEGLAKLEMRRAFNFHAITTDDNVTTHNKVLSSVADSDFIVQVCVIIDKNIKIEKSFLAFSEKFNKVQVYVLDFKNPAKVHKLIQKFFKEQLYGVSTRGSFQTLASSGIVSQTQFEELKPPLNLNTILILNYTYLKCILSSNSFDKSSLTQTFHTSDSASFETEMIHCCVPLRTLRNSRLNATLIELPLVNTNNIFMYIILPTKSNGLVKTEAALGKFNLSLVLPQFSYALVDLTLPRFKLKYGMSLKEVLQGTGINSIFSDEDCSVPAITDEKVAVDYLYQSSVIEFASIIDCDEVSPADKETPLAFIREKQGKEYAKTHKETILVNYPFLYVIRQNDIAGRERSILIGKFTGDVNET